MIDAIYRVGILTLYLYLFSGVSTTQNPFFSIVQAGQLIQYKTLFFNQNTIRLNEWAKQEVILIAEYMSKALGSKAVIGSATPITGKADYKLFAQRAEAIWSSNIKIGYCGGQNYSQIPNLQRQWREKSSALMYSGT